MRRNRTIVSLLLIGVLLLCITIGYAYLSESLSINGTASIGNSSWNIYWDNIVVKSGSVTNVTTPATIKPNNTEVEFDVGLDRPGDYYEFTVDAVNDGSIDAMINVISKGTYSDDGITQITLPDCLEYVVTYSDGVMLQQNHLLEAGTSETYRVLVRFKEDITASQLPNTDNNYVFKFAVEYIQKDDNSMPVRTTVFNVSNTETEIGESMPNITTYNNYQDAITALGTPTFLRHTVANGVIISTDAGFVLGNNVYYVKTGIVETDENPPIYNSNREILLEAFGQANCQEWSNGNYKNITCLSNVYNMSVFAATDGHIETGPNDNCGCFAHIYANCFCS